ncbi:MAG: serine hydrolase [bacterium]
MREIALILLLLTPGWHIFDGPRAYLDNFLKPSPQKETVVTKLPEIVSGPTLSSVDAEYQNLAKSVYSIDLGSNTALNESNKDEKLQIASLTKLMTAYVVLKDSPNLDEKVTIPDYITQAGDALMGISKGEEISKRDLLTGMLLNSGSDAATSLATLDAGSVDGFVTKMNLAAESLNLSNTHFANPVGWDDAGNYSSAKDMLELSRILLRNNFFAETVATTQKVVYTTAGRPIYLTNTNILLDGKKYFGVKTGYTFGAGECLISLEKQDGHEVLTAVIGSASRFSESYNINSWIFTHFVW